MDTTVFLCGMSFALRSGQEHWSLQLNQFELVEPKDDTAYLVYHENCSKNNSGGLADRKVKPKQVIHHANETNPERCLVHMYKKYLDRRPETEETAFYLTPLKKPKGKVWYAKTAVGHNTLAKTVSRVCQAGGIDGYKTNHSLHVITATRLFQSGVDEQLIMDRTGHRSLDGVRTYKRISDKQKESVSRILNAATNGESCELPPKKKPRTSEPSAIQPATVAVSEASSHSEVSVNNVFVPVTPSTSSSSCVPALHFSGCSSFTINCYVATYMYMYTHTVHLFMVYAFTPTLIFIIAFHIISLLLCRVLSLHSI